MSFRRSVFNVCRKVLSRSVFPAQNFYNKLIRNVQGAELMDRRHDGRETWNRLLDWDKGQTPSERLATTLLASEGYMAVDPSHPLGGKDGGKDARLSKDELNLVLAVYFPRGQQPFNDIKKKFEDDFLGVEKNNATGFVFFTNQELRLAERSELQTLCGTIPLDLYHIERIANLLNTPRNYGIRLEFLQIAMTNEEIVALYAQRDKDHIAQLQAVTEALQNATKEIVNYQTGGDSYAKLFIGSHSFHEPNKIRISAHVVGKYPMFDVSIKLSNKQSSWSFHINNLRPNVAEVLGYIDPPSEDPALYLIDFIARNGSYEQIIKIKRDVKLNNRHVSTLKNNQLAK